MRVSLYSVLSVAVVLDLFVPVSGWCGNTVENLAGRTYANDYMSGASNSGENTVINYGTVNLSVLGSYNSAGSSIGGGNEVKNLGSGYVTESIYGSQNTGSGSSGGLNHVINANYVGGNIYGSNNFGSGASGGENIIENSGSVAASSYGYIYGSMNSGSGSSGGENVINNSLSGTVNGIYGSYNKDSASSGDANTIKNNGTVIYNMSGNYNTGDGTGGGDNSVYNHGKVGSIADTGTVVDGDEIQTATGGTVSGSDNRGAGSSGNSNHIYNGTETDYFGAWAVFVIGSYNYADASSGGSNYLYNYGTVEGYVIENNSGVGEKTIISGGTLRGSYNRGAASSGGENYLYNGGTGTLYYMEGSVNYGVGSYGGSSTIENAGTVKTNVVGSANMEAATTGGSNRICNYNQINNYIAGSYNNTATSSGGLNYIENDGTVNRYIIGTYNVGSSSDGGVTFATGGSNVIINNGTVGFSIYNGGVIGAYNRGDYSRGGSNTLTNNAGSTILNTVGSANFGAYSNGGSNTIINNSAAATNLVGSYNNASRSYGGSNTVTNYGTVLAEVYGTYNVVAGSHSGSYSNGESGDINNIIHNYGIITTNLYGNSNAGADSYGGSNIIYNSSGASVGTIYGSSNTGSGSSGGSNSIYNYSGATVGSIYGSNNVGDNSSGGDNKIYNYGTVTGSIYGSSEAGTGTSSIGNTIDNYSTVGGSIYGGGGDDRIRMEVNATVGGSIDAGAGDDTVTMLTGSDAVAGKVDGGDGDNDLLVISGGTWRQLEADGGGNVAGFERYSIDARTLLTLENDWSVGASAIKVSGGILNIEDAFTGSSESSLSVNSGRANINGDATFGTVTVSDTLNVNASLTVGALEVVSGASASVVPGAVVSASETTLAGTMMLNGTVRGNGSFEVISSGLLSGNGTINADVTNNGTISPGNSIGSMVIYGDYTGSGILALEVDFRSGSADTVTVSGSVRADGVIAVSDVTDGAGTSSDEIILLAETSDSDKSDESFVLADDGHRYNGEADLGRWSGSPFIWKLKTSGNNWVLGDACTVENNDGGDESAIAAGQNGTFSSKPAVVPEIPAYISLPTFSYEVVNGELETLHQRLGELREDTGWASLDPAVVHLDTGEAAGGVDGSQLNGWIKTIYSAFDYDAEESFEMDGEYGLAELGFDKKVILNGSNTLFAGFFGSYLSGDFSNNGEGSAYGSLYEADTDIDGWSAGLYGTWFNAAGYFADMTLNYMRLDADIEAVDKYTTDGTVLGGSVEFGCSVAFRPKWLIEPQLQVKVASVQWDGFNDGWNDVEFADHTYVTGRFGIRSEYTVTRESGAELRPWLYIGVQHEFTEAPIVTYVIDFNASQYDTAGNVQMGITWKMDSVFMLYGDVGYTSDFAEYSSCRVDLGVRINW